MFKINDKFYLLSASFGNQFGKQTIGMLTESLGGYLFNLTNVKYFGNWMCYTIIIISVKIVLIHQI